MPASKAHHSYCRRPFYERPSFNFSWRRWESYAAILCGNRADRCVSRALTVGGMRDVTMRERRSQRRSIFRAMSMGYVWVTVIFLLRQREHRSVFAFESADAVLNS